jgi:Type II CAAX prenyl endopeptidase Rce1-like
MNLRTRLFVILWLAGLAGVLSFLLIDLSALLAIFPVTSGTELPFPSPVLKLLSIIQSTVLLSIAVLVGVSLAQRVGLSAPATEAAASGASFLEALNPQIVPGLIGGLVGGVAIILSWVLSRPFLPPEFVARAEQLNKLLPFLTRLLYGGIIEELLIRWGVMTLLIWAAWRVFQKAQGKPRDAYFVSAIAISSIIFGIGHLPLASALASEITGALILYIIVANAQFGLIAGYLYWKKGLESAIIAHMMAHVLIATAIYLGT